MKYKILADLIVMIHFGWILFMIGGFIFTLCCFFRKEFFDRWLLRMIHLFGIIYVGVLAVLGKHCPLTILEYNLRIKHNPELNYPGSFIIYYIEKLVYPDANLIVFLIPTIFIAIFTAIVFIIRPPKKTKRLFSGPQFKKEN